MRAKRNSFQHRIKESIAVTVIPGLHKGRVIYLNTCKRLHPSMRAASSGSTGSPSKNPFMIQMAKGRAIERLMMIKDIRLSTKCSWLNRIKKGRTTTTGGMNWVEIIQKRICRSLLVLNREKLYAARVAREQPRSSSPESCSRIEAEQASRRCLYPAFR